MSRKGWNWLSVRERDREEDMDADWQRTTILTIIRATQCFFCFSDSATAFSRGWHPRQLLLCLSEAASRFGRPKPGKVSKIAAKLLKRKIRTAGKAITKVRPKGITYLEIRSQHAPIREHDGINIPIRKPLHFFLTCSRVRFHSFVDNSF